MSDHYQSNDDPVAITAVLAAMGDTGGGYGPVLARVHRELRHMAAVKLGREQYCDSLQPTDLAHEAFLRLGKGGCQWQSRAHFFGAAAQAMRRVLIDRARRRLAQKRGGGEEMVTIERVQSAAGVDEDANLIALDEGLKALALVEERLAQVVELRFYAGLSIEQTAVSLGVSPATVKRDWVYARAWLHDRLRAD